MKLAQEVSVTLSFPECLERTNYVRKDNLLIFNRNTVIEHTRVGKKFLNYSICWTNSHY